jgi:hypothetical protein
MEQRTPGVRYFGGTALWRRGRSATARRMATVDAVKEKEKRNRVIYGFPVNISIDVCLPA